MYFDNISSAEDLKKQYKNYVKTMHPDRGGHLHTFQSMQAEYHDKLKELLGEVQATGNRFISKEEAMELGKMLCEFLKANRPNVWAIIKNVTTQPLAAGLLKQFAPKYIVEYARLLGLTD